jgi:hypothetical protein
VPVLDVVEAVVRELGTTPSSTPIAGPRWGPCPPANQPPPGARGWSTGEEETENRVSRKGNEWSVANIATIAICSSMILVIHTQHNHGTNQND